MITLNWGQMEGEIGALMSRFEELPRHIAKKHLQAAMKRAGKDAVKVLKANTPKRKSFVRFGGGRNGREYTAEKVRGGSLRRAATFLSKYKGTNKDGAVFGILGYKYGTESRKAIWLEFGTARITPRKMVERSLAQSRGIIASRLEGEMVKALDAAVRELESGMNPGMSKRGLAAGIAPR
jgi:hypothetical protein